MTNGRPSLFVSPFPVSRYRSRAKAKRFSVQTSTLILTGVSARFNSSTSQEERIAASPLLTTHPESRSVRLETLAPRHFINLTNGVEALQVMHTLVNNQSEIRFMRLQSSHCESGAYNKILSSLDDELLFSLACGRECYVYDYASRNKTRGVPRSLFLGLQFVKWSLAYLWFGTLSPTMVPRKVMVRGKNAVPFWRDQVMPYKVSKDTKKKLRYYIPFVQEMGVKKISLFGVYGRVCENDGCKDVHSKMVRDWLERSEQPLADYEQHQHAMIRSGLVLYDADTTADELVEIQKALGSVDVG